MDAINSRPTEAKMRLKYDHVTEMSKSDLKWQNVVKTLSDKSKI